MGRRGAPELELLAVVIVLFAPILHETLTNSNFDANTVCQLSHGSSFKCRELKSISQQKYFADCFTDWHNIMNEDVHVIQFKFLKTGHGRNLNCVPLRKLQ